MTDAFSANMGRNAPFWKALKEWNAKNKLKSWCVPARGTSEYLEVMKIMEEKYAQKKKKTGSAQKHTATSILQAAVRRKNVPQYAAAQPAQAAAQPAARAAASASVEGPRRSGRNRRKPERLIETKK